jgi:hypothetical protein
MRLPSVGRFVVLDCAISSVVEAGYGGSGEDGQAGMMRGQDLRRKEEREIEREPARKGPAGGGSGGGGGGGGGGVDVCVRPVRISQAGGRYLCM